MKKNKNLKQEWTKPEIKSHLSIRETLGNKQTVMRTLIQVANNLDLRYNYIGTKFY